MENRRRPVRPPRRLRTLPEDPLGILSESATLSRRVQDDATVMTRELPVLPVRNTVVLPHMVVPLFVDRAPAVHAIEAAASGGSLLLVTQRSEQTEDPTYLDVYDVGTECTVNRVLKMPDGTTSVMVQGVRRVLIERWVQHSPYGRALARVYEDVTPDDDQIEALARTALTLLKRCAALSDRVTEDTYIQALNIEQPGALADFIVAQLEPTIALRQEILETFGPLLRLRKVCGLLRREVDVLELERKIHDEVQQEADRGQREFFLREQLKAIQRELGEHDPATQENGELRERVMARCMPADVETLVLKEVARLDSMPPMAPEHGVVRSYVDWMVALPWRERTADQLDLRRVAAILDERHYGLGKVKDRILEYIAVRKLAPEGRAPILCLAGPPGVGKTTLGRSIAEALGRQFARISLGGVRDEAEIRGHRRTYVGAMPGRIIQTMKTAATTNPVVLLDEIDKLAADYRGDPSAALLEVLDPEQNSTFVDHYIEAPYDLSGAMFILTANVLHTIPAPLRDRMEVIEIAGYTEEEKLHIARQYLIPRQMRDCGLSPQRIEFDDDAVRRIIREYTFEAGVRGLERELGSIMRQVARRVAEGRRVKALVTAQKVPSYLGPQKYFSTEAEERDEVGVATGLAWTAAGGDLTSVEVMTVPGHGAMTLTGQLGDVMKESAQAALTFTRSRASGLGLAANVSERTDIHVHLPAGGIPKDGPSAGVTMAVAMISALTERPVRRDVAMTGEITLRGRILPVGGLKEKALAAYRAGITTVVLPRRNLRDLDDLAPDIHQRLTFVPVETMDEVLAVALRPAQQTRASEQAAQPLAAARLPARSPSYRGDVTRAPSRVARPRSRRAVAVASA